jgi:peptide deformylase
MSPYKILQYPDDMLEQECSPVTEFGTEELRKIAQRMHATIRNRHSKGFGLAANQVGLLIRLIVINTLGKPGGYIGTIVNPEVIAISDEVNQAEEGCLSFGKRRAVVARSSTVTVKFKTIDGEEVERTFTGLTSICIQHEIDHLNGISLADRGVLIG